MILFKRQTDDLMCSCRIVGGSDQLDRGAGVRRRDRQLGVARSVQCLMKTIKLSGKTFGEWLEVGQCVLEYMFSVKPQLTRAEPAQEAPRRIAAACSSSQG